MNVSKSITDRVVDSLYKKKSDYWERERRKYALETFRKVYKSVPAYQKFLKKNNFNTRSVKTYSDLKKVPQITKKNYLRQYSIKEISQGGELTQPLIFTSSSGSTGTPFYFHRSFKVDWRTSVAHELFFKQGRYTKDDSILVIVCFGMGVWIGGVITYQSFRLMQERGYNVSVITPGINKEEIFKALKLVAPSYKNIILTGYPPFIKDIIDEAPSRGIDWKKLKTRIIFAAEPFTENFRDYCAKKASIANPFLDTMNIYGTAELGAMSFETPLCILIRKLCLKNPELFKNIFGDISRTPTLTQYVPSFISFESSGKDILVNGDSTLPLVRYAIGDRGGVFSFKEMSSLLKKFGINLKKEVKKVGIEKNLYELPFVYVYERDDMSTTLYGLQIYPEMVRDALLKHPPSNFLTGKFMIETRFDSKQNQFLHIHLELQPNQTLPNVMKKVILDLIAENLEQKNSEFRELRKFIGKRALPRLTFWSSGDPRYFKMGIKQKWVKK